MDIRFTDHGSIWLLTPITQEAQDWCADHIPDDAQRWGGAVVVEPRYVEPIVVGAIGDGLAVQVG